MIEGPWFVTPAAIEDYMVLLKENIDDEQLFHQRTQDVRRLCRKALENPKNPARTIGEKEIWYVSDQGRRFELVVSVKPNEKGHADQLIAIADRDRRR